MNSKITFISNNVKGIQNLVKRIKLFEYLKSYVTGNGFIFLQETHSCINDEIMWRDEFNGELFFSHEKTLALCGMDCIDLTKKTIKVLGIHFSYNKKLETEENFIRHVWKIEKVLKLWRMRNLTLEGKITIFKTLAISKIIHLSRVTNVPTQIIKELNKIQKEFIWNGSIPKN